MDAAAPRRSAPDVPREKVVRHGRCHANRGEYESILSAKVQGTGDMLTANDTGFRPALRLLGTTSSRTSLSVRR